MSDRPNVFVLSADSLAQDAFARHASDIADAVDGTEFTTAMATASDTNSAVPGLAAGVLSDAVPGWGLPAEGGPRTVAEVLADEDYRAALWSDNYLFGESYNYDAGFSGGDVGAASWKKRLSRRLQESPLAPAMGVVEVAYFRAFAPLKRRLLGAESFYEPAGSLHDRATRWLEDASEPVLCWLHYMDTHHPYEPPADYLEGAAADLGPSEAGALSRRVVKSNGRDASAAELDAVRAAYDGTCRYLADEVGEFIATLQRRGHFDKDRDVLVFTADHGECLDPERGTMGHVPPAFWESICNVPLVVARPDWPRTVVDDQVSLIDVAPTVLEAARASVPETMVGSAWSEPATAARETVDFVTQWSPGDGDGPMRTYRGARRADGPKAFGAHLDGADVHVGSRVVEDGETETYRGDGPPADPPGGTADLWDRLADRGGALETGAGAAADTDEDIQEHLRDLGYVD